jgi:hypothetical protein
MTDGVGANLFLVNNVGNMRFGGTAQRIFGDFSNTTQISRTMFQDKTSNNDTVVGIVPNGTSTTAGVRLYNNSSPGAPLAMFNLTATSSAAVLDSTVLPEDAAADGASNWRCVRGADKTNKDVLLVRPVPQPT